MFKVWLNDWSMKKVVFVENVVDFYIKGKFCVYDNVI